MAWIALLVEEGYLSSINDAVDLDGKATLGIDDKTVYEMEILDVRWRRGGDGNRDHLQRQDQ